MLDTLPASSSQVTLLSKGEYQKLLILERTGGLAKNGGSLGNLQEGFKSIGLLEREINCRGNWSEQWVRVAGREGRQGRLRVGIRKTESQRGVRPQGPK